MKALFVIATTLSLSFSPLAQETIKTKRYNFELETALEPDKAHEVSFLLENSASIQFISILPNQYKEEFINDSTGRSETIHVYKFESILPFDEFPDSSKIKNRVAIHHSDVKKLALLLFSENDTRSVDSCYQPRHGITFRDIHGELLGYIEISFACQSQRGTVGTHSALSHSDQYEALELLFEKYLNKEMRYYDTQLYSSTK